MINALAAADRLIIPTQAEPLALHGLDGMVRTGEMVERSRRRPLPISILPTLFDRRTRAGNESLRTMQDRHGSRVWEDAIPIDTRISNAAGLTLPSAGEDYLPWPGRLPARLELDPRRGCPRPGAGRMNSTGILDDYLDELLGEAMVAPPPAVLPPAGTGQGPAIEAVAEREPTWDDLPAEVIYETESVAAAQSRDDAALEAAFESAAASGSAGQGPAGEAVSEREPTWDDLPEEVIHETAPAPAIVANAGPEPTWDDLPDEVIYETDPVTAIASPTPTAPACRPRSKYAGGEDVATPPPAVVAAPVAPTVAPAAPAARTATPPPRAAVDAPAGNRPGTWQELQAQAHQPARSPHPQNRRAGERTSRWLRLRCGTQAYALELLKVQEVVLPVPLLHCVALQRPCSAS